MENNPVDYNRHWSPVFDDMEDHVCLVDCDHNLVRANESFKKAFGGDGKKLIGKEGEFYEPGLKKYFSVKATPILSDDHDPIGSIYIAKDVTRLKEEGEELKIRNDFIDKSMTPFAVGDLEGNLIYANAACLKAWGYASDKEVVGRPISEFWKDEEKNAEIVAAYIKKKGWMGELIAKRKDGTTFDCYIVTGVVADNSGKPLYIVSSFTDVTETKRARDEIAASKEYADNIIKSMIDALIVVDPDAQIKTMNQAALKMLGYKEGELTDKPVGTILEEEEEEEEETAPFKGVKFRELLKKGFVTDQEMTWKSKAGAVIPVNFSGSVMRDKNGKLAGIVVIARDVREKKAADDALKELGGKYQTVVENAGDCICLLDTEGGFVHANKMAMVLNEIDDPKQIIGKQLAGMVTPRYREMVSRQIQVVLAGETVKSHYETVTPKKRHKWWEAAFVPLKDLRGRVVNILSISRDMTKDRESKAKLTFFREYAENVMANVPISILVVNRSHQIVYVNKNFLTKMKMEEAFVIGHKLHEVISSEVMTKTSLHDQISEVMKTRDILAGQKFEHRGRSFVYHLVPMRESVGKRFNVAIVTEDVTERNALEEQLEHSERLAMMGQFAAGVAHEVNNPLSIVKGNLQYLMEQIKDGMDFCKRENLKELKGIIYTAEKEVSRCGDIVGKFLHLARRSDHKRKTDINVNSVVRYILHLVERRLSLKKIEVKRNLSARIAAVRGNHDLLQQVVLNLVLNAEQAIARKGTISIKTWQEKQKVYISVKDSGRGIPKELLGYIFNPFFTTKGQETAGGTGLGLSVAHRIIEDHGGTINVTSAPKRGSTFTIALPIARNRG